MANLSTRLEQIRDESSSTSDVLQVYDQWAETYDEVNISLSFVSLEQIVSKKHHESVAVYASASDFVWCRKTCGDHPGTGVDGLRRFFRRHPVHFCKYLHFGTWSWKTFQTIQTL